MPTEQILFTRIEQTLALMAELPTVGTAGPYAEPLEMLFRQLQQAPDGSARAEAEDLIWALWCTHEDLSARSAMQRAIGVMAREELDGAEPLLDRLVADWPEWAEVWNKRATLYYLLERDAESVLDIQRTLQLEPRHFGAMSGFGQICLRAGDDTSALLALELALRVNPNLDAVRETAERLRGQVARVVH